MKWIHAFPKHVEGCEDEADRLFSLDSVSVFFASNEETDLVYCKVKGDERTYCLYDFDTIAELRTWLAATEVGAS